MIDLCVVNYNTRAKLQRFLDVLHSDGRDGWNLYIADNNSTDDSREWITQNENRYDITNTALYLENTGYSYACNALAAEGIGDIIGLLNADVWMYTKDVRRIQQAFDQDPFMSVMGPKQRDESGNITHGGIFGTLDAPKHRGWHMPDPEDIMFRDKMPAVTVSGSAYFIRRSAWDFLTSCPIYREQHPYAFGAFLPTPHYYEETFCSYHAHAHGLGVYYDGRTSIGHSWHASSSVGGEADQQFAASREIFRAMCDFHKIAHD